MRRWVRRALFGVALVPGVPLLILGALALAVAAAPGPAVRTFEADTDDVAGFFHVHTVDSHDGYGTLHEAVDAARRFGADFLVVTEHNRIALEGPQRIDGVLVVPGVELSTPLGHVVALGLERSLSKEERGRQVLDAIARAGGDAIPAHPINRRRPWSDPSTEGFVGFEALSLDSAFRDLLAERPLDLVLALAALPVAPTRAAAIAISRPDAALARYDEINARRPVALLCGIDAHGLPPYAVSFGALRLHLALPAGARASWGRDAAADAAAVRQAIASGATFCSVPGLGDASSFSFTLDEREVVVRVAAEGVTLVLFRDGVEVARGPAPVLRVPVSSGVWRAEALADAPGFPFAPGALWIASSTLRAGEARPHR